jgi:hypothetical protein
VRSDSISQDDESSDIVPSWAVRFKDFGTSSLSALFVSLVGRLISDYKGETFQQVSTAQSTPAYLCVFVVSVDGLDGVGDAIFLTDLLSKSFRALGQKLACSTFM